jgi:HK97 family phage major capsid protein
MDRMAALENEAAEVTARLDAVRAIEGDADVIAARDLELETLCTRAAGIQKGLAFERKVAESAAALRKTVAVSAPAPAAPEQRSEIRPLPYAQKPKYFDSHENAYRSGKFIQAKFLKNEEARQWCAEHGVEARAVVESTNSTGGFTMVDEFSTNLIRLVETYGVAARVLQREVMTTDTKLVPKRLTGTTANWIGENTEITTTDPTGTMVQLVARKLGVGTKVSNEVLNDANAVNVADWLLQEFATAVALAQDSATFNGDGTGTYGGMWGIVPKIGSSAYSASVVSAGSTRTAVTSFTLADYEAVLAKVPRYVFERGNPAWYVHHAVYHQSMQVLGLNAGGNSIDTINNGAGLQYRFLGLPVIPVLVMDSVTSTDANKVKVLCGDMGLSSILGSRQEFSLRMTTERFIELDLAAWYGTGRYDMVHHSLGDTSTPGPVIALKTAAS